MRRLVIIGLCAVSAACSSRIDVTPAHAELDLPVNDSLAMTRESGVVEFPPFIRVIARPELYHGKRVQLVGYMNLEFEGNALYLSEELYRAGSSADALWLDVAGMTIEPPFTQGWVIVEGQFDGERRGHLGLFAGTLEKITRMDAWTTRE